MAPKHWNKSHFLTILLRCRIATWSFIFLKTTEIYQKPALQWKYHHFQQKYFSAPAPPPPFLKVQLAFIVHLFHWFRQAARMLPPHLATAASKEGNAWMPVLHPPGHPQPFLEGRHRSECGLCISDGLEIQEGSMGKPQQGSSVERKEI